MESRRSPTQQNLDSVDIATVHRLHDQGVIPQQLKVTFASPAHEPALWSADLTAWAAKRALDNDEPEWIRDANLDLRWIDAQTSRELVDPTLENGMKFSHRPQAAAPQTNAEILTGIHDHTVHRPAARIETLKELTAQIQRLPGSTKHREDLDVGRGKLSFQQQKLRASLARREAQKQTSPQPNQPPPARKPPEAGPTRQR